MKQSKRFAGIIVKFDNEVLVCQRNYKGDMPGAWSIPCGHLENDENAVKGAKREFFEETNIDIKGKINLVGFMNGKTKGKNDSDGLFHVFLYEPKEKIKPDLKNAQDGDEHLGCKYSKLKDLPVEKNSQLYGIIEKILK
jgi:8-oxo-dGTP pyrophosphatase MutT (NUDIX family)